MPVVYLPRVIVNNLLDGFVNNVSLPLNFEAVLFAKRLRSGPKTT